MKMLFRVLLFVLFLIGFAAFLNAMGWCVGGVCEIGMDQVLK